MPLGKLDALLVDETEDEMLFKWTCTYRKLGERFPYRDVFLDYKVGGPFFQDTRPLGGARKA